MPILKKLKTIYDKIDVATGQNLDVDKPYLILLVPADSGDQEFTSGEWVAIRGRKEAYNYIMDYAISGNYVILNSYILSGGITFGNEVSIYTFARLCIEKYQYGNAETLEYLDQMTIETANIIDISTTSEQLSQLYARELTQRSK